MGHGSNIGTQTGSADVIERGRKRLCHDGGYDGRKIADHPLPIGLAERDGAYRRRNDIGHKGRQIGLDRFGKRQAMVGRGRSHRNGISNGIGRQSRCEIDQRWRTPGVANSRCKGTPLRPTLKAPLPGGLKRISELSDLPELIGPSIGRGSKCGNQQNGIATTGAVAQNGRQPF